MKHIQDLSLERILESAIVVSWKDLMRGEQKGLIHIEYNLAPNGALNDLQVWSCLNRGHWLLVCEYGMPTSKLYPTGIQFENKYKSENLAHIFESIMKRQAAFSLPVYQGRQGLIQISTPTEKESSQAIRLVDEALKQSSSMLV